MIKRYYRLQLKLESAMNVGSGENYATDKDLMKNSKGEPFLPGSSLAGVYRSMFNDEDQIEYFGPELSEQNPTESLRDSKVLVYDGVLDGKANFRISHRDCVALDEFKTGKKGSKFDFEILEPGISFISLIEQNCDSNKDKNIGKAIVERINALGLNLGGKTRRGLGRMTLECVKTATFDLSEPEKRKKWLEFDMYQENDSEWITYTAEVLSEVQESIKIELSMIQKGGISIRKYTTAINDSEKPEPDYEQLCYGNDLPVIPGTSWAGVFLHHLRKLGVEDTILDDMFGTVKNSKQKKASKIRFSESLINDSMKKMITRNAIDRFTSGTIDGALYTERSRFYGNTTLTISIPKCAPFSFKQAIAAAVLDLHMGFMSVGGLTAVGRGIFELTDIKISEKEIPITKPETMYTNILAVLERKENA